MKIIYAKPRNFKIISRLIFLEFYRLFRIRYFKLKINA